MCLPGVSILRMREKAGTMTTKTYLMPDYHLCVKSSYFNTKQTNPPRKIHLMWWEDVARDYNARLSLCQIDRMDVMETLERPFPSEAPSDVCQVCWSSLKRREAGKALKEEE